MRTRAQLIHILYLLVDMVGIFLALLLSALYSISPSVILHSTYRVEDLGLQYIYLLLAFVWYFSSRSTGLYESPRPKLYSIDAYNILKNIFSQIVCLMLVFFVIKERALTRTFLLVYFALITWLMFLGRIGVRLLLRNLRKKFSDASRVIIIGANELGRNVYEKLYSNSVGYNVVGYIDDDPEEAVGKNVLGPISDLETIISQKSIDMIIVALPKTEVNNLNYIINICRDHVVEVKIIPDVASYYLRNYGYSFLGDIPIVSISIDKLSEPYWRVVKQTFDICITLLLSIILFSWCIPIIVLCQKIFNPGPVFFTSERWGKGGKPFQIYKFRTMQSIGECNTQEPRIVPTEKNDHRITKFGRILRRTSIDELPQFYNVLKGEMSIIGPRPFDSREAMLIRNIFADYMIRYYVKPGITGWAQINGYRGGTRDIAQIQKRMDIDNWYMQNWTIGLDIQIFFYTMVKLLTGDIKAY